MLTATQCMGTTYVLVAALTTHLVVSAWPWLGHEWVLQNLGEAQPLERMLRRE